MAELDRTGNLLGARALVVTDRTTEALTDFAGSPSAAAALSSLHQFLDRDAVAEERSLLDQLLSKVLVEHVRGPGAVRWLCRMCDLRACGRDEGGCPVANTVSARHSPATGSATRD